MVLGLSWKQMGLNAFAGSSPVTSLEKEKNEWGKLPPLKEVDTYEIRIISKQY